MKRAARFAVACIVTALLAAAPAAALDWSQPWLAPHDAEAASAHRDDYAWRWFVALNWPLDPATRGADSTRRPGADAAVVWEGWADARSVLRADGADPGPWPASAGLPEAASAAQRFDGLDPGLPIRHLVGGVMQPLADPLAAASHLDETRFNERAFDFIRSRRLYELGGQVAAAASGVAFPAGSVNLKAQWQPIDASQRDRYLSREVQLADGSRRLYGLSALHIAAKDMPNWFWASFEHRDLGPGAAPREAGLESTVWQHYRLVGTMTDFVDAQGRAQVLANPRLESTVQPDSSSCMTCHARASVALDAKPPLRLAIFDEPAASVMPTAPDQAEHASGPHRGFTGRPRAAWFVRPDDPTRPAYAALDFVWTLARARAAPLFRAETEALRP